MSKGYTLLISQHTMENIYTEKSKAITNRPIIIIIDIEIMIILLNLRSYLSTKQNDILLFKTCLVPPEFSTRFAKNADKTVN